VTILDRNGEVSPEKLTSAPMVLQAAGFLRAVRCRAVVVFFSPDN